MLIIQPIHLQKNSLYLTDDVFIHCSPLKLLYWNRLDLIVTCVPKHVATYLLLLIVLYVQELDPPKAAVLD